MSVFEALMFAIAFATLIVLILACKQKYPILELRAQLGWIMLFRTPIPL